MTMPVTLPSPSLAAQASLVETAQVVAAVRGPSLFGIGNVKQPGPPTVIFPAPVFVSWNEAQNYARAAMKRIRYLEGQVAGADIQISDAQIQRAAIQEELRLLNLAAAELLVQGIDLA